MQATATGREAHAFVKEEFQAFMSRFVNPLMQNTVRARFNADEILEDGTAFRGIVKEWRDKLWATFQRGQRHGGEHTSESWWRAAEGVPKQAYKPSEWPYFITYDRATMHSFWLGQDQEEHLRDCGVPLLQVLIMPPHGHDLHQLVEHSIGSTKNYVKKVLGKARARNDPPGTKMCYDAVKKGSELYTKDSWAGNFERLQNCLKIVATDREHNVTIVMTHEDRWGHEHVREVVVRGTNGGYCPKQFS